MAKILCITTGLTGILNASFELMGRLERMGHTVTAASPAMVGLKVGLQGFPYLQLASVNYDPAPEVPAYDGALRKVKRLVHKLINVRARRKQAVEALGMDAFLRRMSEFQPDLVIIDIELHEHIMALYSVDYNLLLLSQWFSTWDGKGLPPIQSDIIPGKGFEGSDLGMKLSWMKIRRNRWFIFFKKKLNTVYTDRRSILQKYAKEVGFPRKFIRKNYWPGPFSYEGLPVISITAESLEFDHDVRAGLKYVGPMVYEQRKEETLDDVIENRLEAIFTERANSSKRLIYCSVSTFSQGDTAFLKRVVAAVKGRKNWELIISLGGKLETEDLGELPDNVHAFKRVPQLRVLKAADLSINHGGIHTINESLHFRTPMLVYSGKRSDQNGCAARIHYHSVGLMADKDKDQPEDIARKIDQILDTQEIPARIAKLMVAYDNKNILLQEVLKGIAI